MKREKTGMRLRVLTVVLTMVLTVVSVLPVTAQTVSAASNTSILTKYLKCYKAGNYKKAGKYLKKLKATDKDTSLKKMSAAQKKAYRKLVKKYSKNINNRTYSDPYMWGYCLADLNQDKRPELLIKYGTCEADVRTFVYTYANKKAKKVTEVYSGHTAYAAFPGKGVLAIWGHMGACSVSLLKMKNGKLTEKAYGSQQLSDSVPTYCVPDNIYLYSHIRYLSNGKIRVDYKDLK